MSSNYPEDEFDRPDPDAPVGVHRRPPSKWRPVIPFLIILVCVPLLAWAFSSFLMRDTTPTAEPQSTPVVAPPQSEPQSAEPVTPVVPETPQSANVIAPPGQENSNAENPGDNEIDYGAEVAVLNNSGVDGLAGESAELLEGHGFTHVFAENAQEWTTEVNTVYYADPAMENTAKRVAELLGIDAVEHYEAASADGAVVVIIAN